jgi:hypothetical protein
MRNTERTRQMAPRPHRRATGALLLLSVGAFVGCDITSFTGPAVTGPNQLVSYSVGISSLGNIAVSMDLHVLLRVPSNWGVSSASYSGTVKGSSVSGTPTQSGSNPTITCDFTTLVGAKPAGFQDVYFSATCFRMLSAATAADETDDASQGACGESATLNVTVLPGLPSLGAVGLVVLATGLATAGLVSVRRFARS